jgi:restriction system protein
MTNVWCVRAGGGMYAESFLRGGFVGIGWREISEDLGPVKTREQLYYVVRRYFPTIQSAILLSNYVNEIHRFLFEIQPNDLVIIPSADADLLSYGVVDEGTPYYPCGIGAPSPGRPNRFNWTTSPHHSGIPSAPSSTFRPTPGCGRC